MATEADLRELLAGLEAGAPTVSSVLDALALDRPTLDRSSPDRSTPDRSTPDRPAPVTRHGRGWRVAGAAAACATVLVGVGVLTQFARSHDTGAGNSGPTRSQPISSTNPPAANARGGLSAADRGLALTAAHHAANQYAVGRNRRLLSGWPEGISAVTAVAQPGTVTATESNTGHACASGTIIMVRLAGAFGDHTAGNLNNSHASTTVREIDLTVDATTGALCLSSARTQPVSLGRDVSVLYRR